MNSLLSILIMLTLVVNGDSAGEEPAPLPEKKISRSLERSLGEGDYDFNMFFSDPAGKYYRILSEGGTVGFLYEGRVNTCRPGGCAVPGEVITDQTGFENFRYYMILDTTLRVKEIKIYEYNATHGQEVSARSWLKQFIGMIPGVEFSYGAEVEAISGATISGISLTSDVQRTLNQFKSVSEEICTMSDQKEKR